MKLAVDSDMVNVNIEIPDELHKRLKLAAVLGETTIKDLVVDLLREAEHGQH
jgi:hypothetical protein